MVSNYILVNSSSVDVVQRQVQSLIEHGYHPVGEIKIIKKDGIDVIVQQMEKKESEIE